MQDSGIQLLAPCAFSLLKYGPSGYHKRHSDLISPLIWARITISLFFNTSEISAFNGRAAFEGFGELVEVKIIMDKISKRSKGYAFIEYTTEEAASAALREMNGKIINGWMIVVDVAKTSPPRYSRSQSRPATR
ncbi:organelle RRM domain-containing protein 1, chloroplastic-like [Prunus avium]|uniref:Organelle RRM domain-containing protein 1, chloroplastic-like n=1 Tax=Prunus avium TaxID=42229 RepID=A0A6P5TF79_PRUAV|nr:organelle RRM domain-containing protein 1, chloroplastic-like [Prunus avium]